MGLYQDVYIPSCDGRSRLHVMSWMPETEEPAGVFQLAHGIGEHIGRYGELAGFLTERGYIVFGNDHLGHGLTGEKRGFISDSGGWDAMEADFEALYRIASEKYSGLPYFMLGHSMGSFLVRDFLSRSPRKGLAGVVLCGTAELSGPLMRAARGFCRAELKKLGPEGVSENLAALCQVNYNNKFRPCRTRVDWISSDQDEVEKWLLDEMCFDIPSVGLFSDMIDGLCAISGKGPAAPVPALFMSGSRDPVSRGGKAAQKVGRAFIKAGCKDVTLRLYPDCRHELLHETCREEIFSDIFQWAGEHII